MAMIRLSGIARTYRLGSEEVHALVDIDETIDTAEHVAIMGPSGSGKSTLLNTLGCLDRPTTGSYLLAGRDVSRLSDAELTQIRRHEIGFVFQFFHLVPRLTAAENVGLPLVFDGVPRSERVERVAAALEHVGLTDRATHRPNELSGGERQRVALARATIMRPKILLADEPTGNLDTKSGRVVLDLLDELNDEGLTLIVVTHDAAVARRADRILVLVDGRVRRRLDRSQVDEVVALLGEQELAEEATP
jgi:putative ABC transport system ATP-binding protein